MSSLLKIIVEIDLSVFCKIAGEFTAVIYYRIPFGKKQLNNFAFIFKSAAYLF